MVIQKKNFLYVIFLAVLFLAAGLCFGCGEQKETQVSFSGNGQLTETTLENGNKAYSAVPHPWNEFLGWYDGETLLSKEDTFVVDGHQPEEVKAIFATNAEISLDRFMKALCNTAEMDSQEDYFNMQASFDLDAMDGVTAEFYTLDIASSLALHGEENSFAVSIKDAEKNEKIGVKFKNNALGTQFYLSLGENEYKYDLPLEFKAVGFSGEYTSLETLFGSTYETLHGILGYDNSLSFVENVENYAGLTKLTLRIDKLLNFAKNVILPNVAENDVWLKETLETFTKKYQGLGRDLPTMRVEIEIKYAGDEERIYDISGKFTLAEDYKLELGETVTIKKGSVNFDMTDMEIGYGENAATIVEIPQEIAAIEVGNLSLQGQVDFLHKDSASLQKKVIDSYTLSINADINPFIFKQTNQDGTIDWSKIAWENFGYLNIRLSLVEAEEEKDLQASRHNGATEFFNLLIDSDKFGANMLLYGALYNPKMSVVGETITDKYVLNSTVYLPLVMKAYSDSLQSSFPQQADANLQLIVDALKGTISFIVNNSSININDIIYKFIDGIMKSDDETVQAVKQNFYFENDKIFLTLDNDNGEDIKEIITQGMSKFSAWLQYSNFTSNLFGSATHISFDFSALEYGVVGEEEKADGLKLYNEKHITLVGVESEKEEIILTADYKNQLQALKGEDIAVNGIFSDGSIADRMEDCTGAEKDLILTIWDYEVVSQDEEKVVVNIYLSYAQGTFASILFDNGIPCGLISYQKEISLT